MPSSTSPRARIRRAGYRVERGDYIGTTDDRSDGWYLYRPDRDIIDRRGPGHHTLADAADAAEECEIEKSDHPCHRARIHRVGYRVERGDYIGTTDDRSNRWYLYRPDRDIIDHRGPGHDTLADAADAAEERVI